MKHVATWKYIHRRVFLALVFAAIGKFLCIDASAQNDPGRGEQTAPANPEEAGSGPSLVVTVVSETSATQQIPSIPSGTETSPSMPAAGPTEAAASSLFPSMVIIGNPDIAPTAGSDSDSIDEMIDYYAGQLKKIEENSPTFDYVFQPPDPDAKSPDGLCNKYQCTPTKDCNAYCDKKYGSHWISLNSPAKACTCRAQVLYTMYPTWWGGTFTTEKKLGCICEKAD